MDSWTRTGHPGLSALLLLLLPAMTGGCSGEKDAAADLAALTAEFEADEGMLSEKRSAFASRYRALVREHWGTEAALGAALWLMEKEIGGTSRARRPAIVAEFSDSILGEYAESPALERWAELAAPHAEGRTLRHLERLRSASPHPAVRAASIYYPALRKLREARTGMDGDTADSRARVEADLKQLIDQYGDVPMGSSTYGIMADAHLYPHSLEDLAIGRPAPEIVGRTADGHEMRLSDFRGKVTVLTFWGDW